MQINWFEIFAQFINFFILVFVLQKLFYKPIINAMDKRQQNILDIREGAKKDMETAKRLIENYQQKMKEINVEEAKALKAAREEALIEKEKLLEIYREEANEKRLTYLAGVDEEKDKFLKNLRIEVGKQAIRIASSILKNVARKELSDQTFQAFLAKFDEIDESMLEEEKMSEKESLILYSSHIVSDFQKKELESKLKEIFGRVREISYELNEELIMGYEIKLGTINIHKNVNKHLEEVERKIKETIERESV